MVPENGMAGGGGAKVVAIPGRNEASPTSPGSEEQQPTQAVHMRSKKLPWPRSRERRAPAMSGGLARLVNHTHNKISPADA